MQLGLIFDVFRKGSAVKDAVSAKNKAMLGIAIGGFISLVPALAKVAGYNVELSQDDANQIGVAIATVAGLFSTYATSDKVGILPAKTPPDSESPPKELPSTQQEDVYGGR